MANITDSAEKETTAESLEASLGKIGGQLFNFVDGLSKTRDLVAQYKGFILDGSSKFYNERNERAEEARELRDGEAPKIAHALFGDDPAVIMCMDGRMGTVRVFLTGAGVGSAMKSAGGFVPECVKGENGNMVLLKDTQFAEGLIEIAKERKQFTEVLVSHTSCAAAGLKEAAKGESPTDDGLLTDVRTKEKIGKALGRFLAEHTPGISFCSIQFVFGIKNGFGYMGAETSAAQNALQPAESLTVEVMDRLSNEGKLISTKVIAEELKELFTKYSFEPNWSGNYKKDLERAWQNIRDLAEKENVLQKILPYVQKVYPGLASGDPSIEGELRKRSLLLLLNAYAGYLNNIGGYKSQEHCEHNIRVGDREFGPFFYEILGVSGSNLRTLVSEIITAVSIVRKNRRDGRAPGKAEAPVTIRAEKVVRGLKEDDWHIVENLDLSDLPKTDWRVESMSLDSFEEYLTEKLPPDFAHSSFKIVLQSLNRLRTKLSVIYNPKGELCASVMDGNIVVVPSLSDRNRKTRLIVPFRMDYFTEDSK